MEYPERTTAMWCHLLSFAGIVGIPLGNILGPLIIWLIKKEESEFIDESGMESINFQISLTIYASISALLVFLFIGIIGLLIILIIDIVCVIQASIAATKGAMYRYPISIRFIK